MRQFSATWHRPGLADGLGRPGMRDVQSTRVKSAVFKHVALSIAIIIFSSDRGSGDRDEEVAIVELVGR